jgi:hypothetical protein
VTNMLHPPMCGEGRQMRDALAQKRPSPGGSRRTGDDSRRSRVDKARYREILEVRCTGTTDMSFDGRSGSDRIADVPRTADMCYGHQ